MFTSKKIADEIKVTEPEPPLINEQCVVYEYKCGLSDAGYVGYTCRHLLVHNRSYGCYFFFIKLN